MSSETMIPVWITPGDGRQQRGCVVGHGSSPGYVRVMNEVTRKVFDVPYYEALMVDGKPITWAQVSGYLTSAQR